MIMLAKVVPYGGNAVRYAMEKEKATVVKDNHMPEDIDATSIWYMMKHHCQLFEGERTKGRKLERFMTSFVISPQRKSLPTSRWKTGQTFRMKHCIFLILSDSYPRA